MGPVFRQRVKKAERKTRRPVHGKKVAKLLGHGRNDVTKIYLASLKASSENTTGKLYKTGE